VVETEKSEVRIEKGEVSVGNREVRSKSEKSEVRSQSEKIIKK
jgi:hypothetical protein